MAVKYRDVKECQMHQAIVKNAKRLLETRGCFRKDELVEMCGCKAVADSISWEFVRRWIEEDHGEYALIPLADSYWTDQPKITKRGTKRGRRNKQTQEWIPADELERSFEEKKRNDPGRYIAKGYSKKTAGFGLVSGDNGSLAIRFLEHKRANAAGSRRVADTVENTVRELAPGLIESGRKDVMSKLEHAERLIEEAIQLEEAAVKSIEPGNDAA